MNNPLTPVRLAAQRSGASGEPSFEEPVTVICEEVFRLE